MAAHTKIDLYQMQSLPLDAKIRMTARRIDAFIDRNDAYLSISGGKDSRVLDDIERRFVRAKLPRVFIDTGLEHRSVRACGKKHADIILRPEKNFKQIITEYGYPVISKEVKTLIMTAHIDKAVEEIERRREAAGRGVEYKAFEMYFMQGMDYAEIAEELDTGKNTPRRWVTGIINELSVLLWGIDEKRVK